MELMQSTIFNDKDRQTFEEDYFALNVDIDRIELIKEIGEGKSLLHIINEDEVVGFIILSKPEVEEVCHFDGCIYEVSIAIYKDDRGNQYALEALRSLDDWVKNNLDKVRLEAVIRNESPCSGAIKKTLKSAGYVTGMDICRDCKINYCGYQGLLQEWRKEIK